MSERRAVVAGHADFAEGIISAVAQIAGRQDAFIPLSNRDLSAKDVELKLRELVSAPNVTTIFTDLPAGSCTMAARRLLRERRDLVLVTGANLASLLEFVFSDASTAADVARDATDRGRTALSTVEGEERAPRGD
ncbi:MAG: PTS sugar transporter subunit IIA [Gemmatimonadaceae bacterium]